MTEAKKGRKAGVSDIAYSPKVGLSSEQDKLLKDLQKHTKGTASGTIARLFEEAGKRELIEHQRAARQK